MGDQFLGHWKLDSSENWDEYMKAAGVGLVTRKVASNLTSYEEWKREGSGPDAQWTLDITSTFKSKHLTFKLNVQFDEDTLDGRKVKSTVTLEGDKIVHKQNATKEGEIDSTVTREILPDGRLLVTFVAEKKGVTAKRYFTAYKP